MQFVITKERNQPKCASTAEEKHFFQLHTEPDCWGATTLSAILEHLREALVPDWTNILLRSTESIQFQLGVSFPP